PTTHNIHQHSLHDALPTLRERPGKLHPGQLHGDGARFTRTDPDREHAGAIQLLEDDDRRVRGPIETETLNFDFNHVSSPPRAPRSEEHTSELQSREKLVCR